jgi:4a-hydroxytetrahydrobiopterin dehydratase
LCQWKLIKATEAEIQQFIAQHTTWSVEEDKLHCQYVFNNFIEAFSFMTKVALIAESLNHHPEWFNTYKQVAINLITHEVGGISKRVLLCKYLVGLLSLRFVV